MIIKTASQFETDVVSGLKASLRKMGIEVYVVPKGIDWLFVTIESFNGENHIVVQVTNESGDLLDATIGFESSEDGYTYARKIAFAAGLNENAVDGDVWEVENVAE